jgi:exonuclease III
MRIDATATQTCRKDRIILERAKTAVERARLDDSKDRNQWPEKMGVLCLPLAPCDHQETCVRVTMLGQWTVVPPTGDISVDSNTNAYAQLLCATGSCDDCGDGRWNYEHGRSSGCDPSGITALTEDPRDGETVRNTQGIHPHPGPHDRDCNRVTLICRNIRSLNSNLIAGLSSDADFIGLQEVDLAAHNVNDIKEQARTAGYDVHFGNTVQIVKDGAEFGKRVAVCVKQPVAAVHLTEECDDENVKRLLRSGRLVERLVPVGNEGAQIIIAVLYGAAGASVDKAACEENEALLAAAGIRAADMKDIPYYILMDANIDPGDSERINQLITAEILWDVFADSSGGTPPLTSRKHGILPEMDGENTSRIDLVLCNAAAAHACKELDYMHAVGRGFDHVPLKLTLDFERFQDKAMYPIAPAKIEIRCKGAQSEAQRRDQQLDDTKRFEAIWIIVEDKFEAARRSSAIEGMHSICCGAAETFLWRKNEWDINNARLPTHLPRRGQVLPTEERPVANKIKDTTRAARNNFSKCVAEVTGITGDCMARLKRLQGLHLGARRTKEEYEEVIKRSVTLTLEEGELTI